MNETADNSRTRRAAYAKRRYHERKSSCLCVNCGKPNDTGKVLCADCRTRYNEQKRQDRIFYAGLGLCHKCGKNRIFRNEKRCPECRAKAAGNAERREKTDRDREKERACHKILYQERREQGICVKCGKHRAVQGKTRCEMCRGKERERDRQRYVPVEIPRGERNQHGLCYTCSNSLDMDGMKVCSRCYADLKSARETIRENSSWKKDNGVIFQKRIGVSPGVTAENAKIIFHTAPYADAFRVRNEK